MTSKVIESHKSSSNFSFNPTIPLLDSPLMLPAPNFVDLSHSIFLSFSLSIFSLPLSLPYSLSISLLCSMQTLIYTQRNTFHKIKYDLKGTWGHFYVAWFLKIWLSFLWTTLILVLTLYFSALGAEHTRGRAEKLIISQARNRVGVCPLWELFTSGAETNFYNW